MVEKLLTANGEPLIELIRQKDEAKLGPYKSRKDINARTARVDLEKPLFFDGQPMFDMIKNVDIWTRYWVSPETVRKMKTDETYLATSFQYLENHIADSPSSQRQSNLNNNPFFNSNFLGIRLIRTRSHP